MNPAAATSLQGPHLSLGTETSKCWATGTEAGQASTWDPSLGMGIPQQHVTACLAQLACSCHTEAAHSVPMSPPVTSSSGKTPGLFLCTKTKKGVTLPKYSVLASVS